MRISDQKIKEFKVLYKKHFNQEIDDSVVLELGNNLAEILKLIYKPIKREDLKNN